MLWLAVTPDKYELPIAVADTAKELSIMLGLRSHTITELYHQHNKGILSNYVKYKIVKVTEEAQNE